MPKYSIKTNSPEAGHEPVEAADAFNAAEQVIEKFAGGREYGLRVIAGNKRVSAKIIATLCPNTDDEIQFEVTATRVD